MKSTIWIASTLLLVQPMIAIAMDDDEKDTTTAFERVEKDEDARFLMGFTRIDFKHDPDGKPLPMGTDITETFVKLGCTFHSSIEDSFVAVEPYNVGARSGHPCAANHKPLYQGVITIRFCKPGEADIAATVRTVGFWTSHIAVEGTALEAFDKEDRRICIIKTKNSVRDFLAIKSKTPIAYIKVVPNVEIDPDFAIDDLVFDMPTPVK